MGADIDLHDMENELQELLNHRRALDADGTSSTVAFKMRLSERLESLPVVGANKFTDDIVMFGCCVTGQSRPRSEVAMVSLPRHTATGTSQPRHKNDRHRTWMMEQALVHMVREGNLDYKKVLEQSARISDGVPVKVRDSLQQAQVSGITLTTLCVRAAIGGGLTPYAAYTVVDSYIQQVMDCKTLPEVAQTNHTMYDDFVHRVHKIRHNPSVSPRIQQCMDYLELHTEEVGIAQLSRMTGYTEYYLSRNLKKKRTVPSMITAKSHALNMLRYCCILRMKVRPKSPIVCIFAAAAILHGNLKNSQGKRRQTTARKIQNKKYRNRLYRRFRYFLWNKCFMRLQSKEFLWLFSQPQTRQLAFPAWRKRGSTDR